MPKNVKHKTNKKDCKKYEHYISNAKICECNDAFFINEECPFYNLITEEYFVIDDDDEGVLISHRVEKRPIAEYCNFINDYSFNCYKCENNNSFTK